MRTQSQETPGFPRSRNRSIRRIMNPFMIINRSTGMKITRMNTVRPGSNFSMIYCFPIFLSILNVLCLLFSVKYFVVFPENF